MDQQTHSEADGARKLVSEPPRHPRTWTDQPEEVERVPKLASGFSDGVAWEVRGASSGPHYVTGGNLFGSQTAKCRDAHVALLALGLMFEAARLHRALLLPDGAQLLKEPESR